MQKKSHECQQNMLMKPKRRACTLYVASRHNEHPKNYERLIRLKKNESLTQVVPLPLAIIDNEEDYEKIPT